MGHPSITTIGLCLGLLAGCRAEAPGGGDGTGFPPVQGPYPSVAVCTPPTACPGPACATNAVGPPDGRMVDMSTCKVLELTFTTGTVMPVVDVADLSLGVADLSFRVGTVNGVVRVDASKLGSFEAIGFLCSPGCPRPSSCVPEAVGNDLQLYVDRCNYAMPDFNVLRLTLEQGSSAGPTIDAVTALSFKAIDQ